MILIAVVVVVSIKLLGIVLVSALLVIPGAVGRLFASSYGSQYFIAIGVALASVFTGLTLSYQFDIASGASIVLTGALIFFISMSLRGKTA